MGIDKMNGMMAFVGTRSGYAVGGLDVMSPWLPLVLVVVFGGSVVLTIMTWRE